LARERFRVECIKIEDITSHVNTKLRTPPGSLALIGENGSGKSSVLEAIHLALTLEPWRTRNVSDIVRAGSARRGRVVLTLVGDRGTRAELSVAVSARGQRKREARVKVNGRVEATQINDYLKVVARLLGFGGPEEMKKLVGHAVLVKQGGLRQIVEAMSSPRRFGEMIEEAVGVPDYRKAAEKLADIDLAQDLEGVRGSWSPPSRPDPRTPRYKRLVDAIQKARERAEQAERQRANALAQEERARREAERLEQELGEAREALTRLEQAAARLEELERAFERLEARLRERRGELDRAQVEFEEAVKTLGELERLARLAELAPLAERLAQLDAALAKARARADTLQTLTYSLEEAEGLEDVEARLREAREALARLEERLREASRMLQEVARRLGALEAAAQQVEAAARAAARLLDDPPGDPLALLDALRREIARLREELEAARRAAEEARERAARARAEAEAAERALAALRASRGARCPVCGSPLSEEARSRLETELHSRLRVARAEEARAGREAEEARSRVEALEGRLRLLEAAAERLEAALQSYDPRLLEELRAERSRLEEELRSLEEEARRLRGEVSRLSAEAERMRARLGDAWAAARKLGLASLPGLEEAREMLRAALGEVAVVESELESVRGRLLSATGAGSVAEAVEAVKRAVEAARRLEAARAEAERARARVDSLRDEIARIKEELEDVRARAEEARREAAGLEEARARVEALEDSLRGARERAARARAEAEAAERALAEARRELEGLGRVRERMEAAMAAAYVFGDVGDVLVGEALAHLENAMNDVLEKFDLDYVSIRLVRRDGGVVADLHSRNLRERVPVGLVSGGESAAIALAYVLALQRILSAGIDFLALDEPTSDLDESRRGVLLDVLGGAVGEAGVRQLIIVTHHDEVVDRVDAVCRLRKEGGATRISKPDGSPCPAC